MDRYWLCDTCGEKIRTPDDGVLEWYSFVDDKGVNRCDNLRLVHGLAASPLRKLGLKRKGCEFDLHKEQFRTAGQIGNRTLGEFLGPDGLVRLLAFIPDGRFQVAEVLKMIKRLHVPGFEMAREYFRKATQEGIIEPDAAGDHCRQTDITAVLKWMEETGR